MERKPGTLFIPRDAAEAEELLATKDEKGLPVAGPTGQYDTQGRELWGFREDWGPEAYARTIDILMQRRDAFHRAALDGVAARLLTDGKAPVIPPLPHVGQE